jgi:hypothetical protein
MFKNVLAAVAALTSASAFAQAASAPAIAASAVPVVVTAAEVGFFSAAVAFAAGLLLTWPAFIVLVFLGILFEHNGARGWAVFTALAVAAVSYFFFSVSLLTIAIGAVGYIVIGLIWSFCIRRLCLPLLQHGSLFGRSVWLRMLSVTLSTSSRNWLPSSSVVSTIGFTTRLLLH